jgi:hypothetical protein
MEAAAVSLTRDAAIAAAFLTVGATGTARADGPPETAACLAAHVDAQRDRRANHLVAAHKKLLFCAQEGCPGPVAAQCSTWLTEVDASLPTIVLAARDAAGRDVADATVRVDGALVAARLDGAAMPLDPGEHAIRFERAGASPVDVTVVVREGEKRRAVSATFSSAPAAPEIPTRSSAPIPFWIALGTGTVAVGVFGAFAIKAKHDYDVLDATCPRPCSPDKIGTVRREAAAADVALATGVVALGVATVLFFVAPAGHRSAALTAPAVVW